MKLLVNFLLIFCIKLPHTVLNGEVVESSVHISLSSVRTGQKSFCCCFILVLFKVLF